MDTLVDRLILVRRRLGSLPVKLGVPQHQPKIILLLGSTYTPLEPNPKIEYVSPTGTSQYFSTGTYLTDTVQILGDELIVSSIARTYPMELLQEATWIIGATHNEAQARWEGQKANCVWLDKNQTTTWQAVLAPRKAK